MKKPFKKEANNYTLYGVLFGAVFPIIATILDGLHEFGAINPSTAIEIQTSNPLLWIIDSAPFWLGLFARFGGCRQDAINTYAETLETAVAQRTENLRTAYERLSHEVTEHKQAQKALQDRSHDLAERVKELHCLYGISELVERPGISLEEILQGSVELLPGAWQYPEITGAQIIVKGQQFQTEGFRQTPWMQTCHILIHGEPSGIVVVCYLEKRPEHDEGPFIKEERELINAIGERLGHLVERKESEKALLESEERFKELADLFPQAIFEMDLEGNFTFVNNYGIETYGYAREDINEGLNAIQLFVPEDRDRATRNISKVLAGIEFEGHEYTLLRKDGSTFFALLYSSPIIHDDKPIGLRGIVLDITERKRTESALQEAHDWLERRVQERTEELTNANEQMKREMIERKRAEDKIQEQYDEIKVHAAELEAANDELRHTQSRLLEANHQIQDALDDLRSSQQQLLQSEKLAAIGELVSGVAHELNNPLAAIAMHAELLESKLEDERSLNHIRILASQAERAASIVTNLLSFARKHEPRKDYVSINKALETTVELRAYELNLAKIGVTLELDPDLPRTMADFHQLQQVFLNLVGNAEHSVKAVYGRGNILVKSQRDGEMVQVSVSDDGAGIPADLVDRIFEPFFTTKAVGQGTGLGLSICYGIIEEHGGRISVVSNQGEGATFTVTLPIVHEAVGCPA